MLKPSASERSVNGSLVESDKLRPTLGIVRVLRYFAEQTDTRFGELCHVDSGRCLGHANYGATGTSRDHCVARSEERRACESPESFAKLPTPIASALGVPPANVDAHAPTLLLRSKRRHCCAAVLSYLSRRPRAIFQTISKKVCTESFGSAFVELTRSGTIPIVRFLCYPFGMAMQAIRPY